VKKHFWDVPAELVIHSPERTIEFTEGNEALRIPKGTVGTVLEEKGKNYLVSLEPPHGFRPGDS